MYLGKIRTISLADMQCLRVNFLCNLIGTTRGHAPPEQENKSRKRKSRDPRMKEEGEGNFQDNIMGNPRKAAQK